MTVLLIIENPLLIYDAFNDYNNGLILKPNYILCACFDNASKFSDKINRGTINSWDYN